MAYRGDTSEILASVVPAAVVEAPIVVAAKPVVPGRDARMVRIALGMIVTLAVIDLCLYLPHWF